jgi:subtilase family serine protease
LSTRAGYLGIAVASVLGAATLIAASPAANAATWVPTATKALPLASATPLGAATPAIPLRLTIGLAPRNRAALDTLMAEQARAGSAQYEQFLTPAQFTAEFAPTSAAATQVADYLASQGMGNVQVADNRLQVTADATVGQAESAFNTAIGRFSQGGKTVLANTAPAYVPQSLDGLVTAVLGLSDLGFSASPAVSAPKLTGYYPKEFTKVYDGAATGSGTGTSLAVIAEGDLSQTVTDLRNAEKAQGLAQVPVSIVHTGIASPDTAGVDEWDLDTQTSTGLAPNAKRLYLYDATSLTNSDLARAINSFAAQDVAQAGSASLGECDLLPFLDGSMIVDDLALAQAAVQGQTFFASTGDTGSSCAVVNTNGVPGSGPADTEYPASSPYAVGVGGTTLITDDSNAYQNEIAWNAGGGGVSPVENSGFWQGGVVPSAAAGARGVPDIAFDADPNTGALIYVDGTPVQIGGTSLSSPLALGAWTRLQSGHHNSLGFAAPKLYGIYSAAQASPPLPPLTGPASFHDVVIGTNGLYAATPGWDYTTGLGSWDLDVLNKAVK